MSLLSVRPTVIIPRNFNADRTVFPIATLINSLNLLIDSLTGLERILTTPIPFSYSIHLWVVTATFSFLLVRHLHRGWSSTNGVLPSIKPFQLWATFKYLTIPATAIAVSGND